MAALARVWPFMPRPQRAILDLFWTTAKSGLDDTSFEIEYWMEP
jgi:hypothetical protein